MGSSSPTSMEKASAGDAEFSLGSLKAVFFRPLRGLVLLSLLNPRLTPWAAFFRRFAAGSRAWPLLILRTYSFLDCARDS